MSRGMGGELHGVVHVVEDVHSGRFVCSLRFTQLGDQRWDVLHDAIDGQLNVLADFSVYAHWYVHTVLLPSIRRVFTLDNLCMKEKTPPTHLLELDDLLSSLNPCLVLTPLDCFWEGSFLHQPVHQVQFNICTASWASNVTWSNVNVTEVLQCVKDNGTTNSKCSFASAALPSVKEVCVRVYECACVRTSVCACVHACVYAFMCRCVCDVCYLWRTRVCESLLFSGGFVQWPSLPCHFLLKDDLQVYIESLSVLSIH